MKPVREYLQDMLTYIGYLEAFAAEGHETLEQDVKTRLAVEKSYEVIGEITKRLPDELLQQQPHIPWKQIKGFRDILIHQYNAIELKIVLQALKELPNLRTAVEEMLANLPAEDADADENE